jgi:sRNA-binding regulator protein Hfq
MSIHAIVPPVPTAANALPQIRNPLHTRRYNAGPIPVHMPSQSVAEDNSYHQAELFYLQKQIQSQTPMVIVLEDGEHVNGCIEWYDRNCLKVRGRFKTLVYKSAIKYMYKLGEQG